MKRTGRGLAWVARMRVAAVVAVTFAACAYQPGSYRSPPSKREFVGQRATVGCLDVAVDRRGDHAGAAVLAYTFGNRCDGPAVVDLAWAQVIGRAESGAEIALTPYDPKRELRPLKLDGRISGGESIAYPSEEPLGQVCVDVASIAQQRPAQWLCFGNPQPIAMVTP